MRHLFAASAALFIWISSPAGAQSSKPAAKTRAIRRAPDGHPDLQGLCLALADWSAELRLLTNRGEHDIND